MITHNANKAYSAEFFTGFPCKSDLSATTCPDLVPMIYKAYPFHVAGCPAVNGAFMIKLEMRNRVPP